MPSISKELKKATISIWQKKDPIAMHDAMGSFLENQLSK